MKNRNISKLIILDRDGVINKYSADQIRSTEDFIPIDGSLEAIATLCQLGYEVAVATNQSGISEGLFDEATLEAMHEKLQNLLHPLNGKITYFAYCPHLPNANCGCRKPKPGLLHEISDNLNKPLINVPVVGDTLQDLQAALAVNAKPILVKTGKGESTIQQGLGMENIAVFENLRDVVNNFIN